MIVETVSYTHLTDLGPRRGYQPVAGSFLFSFCGFDGLYFAVAVPAKRLQADWLKQRPMDSCAHAVSLLCSSDRGRQMV